jgi:dienelactone hydrolase
MASEFISYVDDGLECEAYVARPARLDAAPAVLVCHAWGGQDDFARRSADRLAGLGYVGFALDVYGKGRRGTTKEECSALMTPLAQDRALLRRRLLGAVREARSLTGVDPSRIAAIGYCFGGLCALDLARANASGLRAVVSFHGLLSAPEIGPQLPIGAEVLVLHGYDDPMCTPEQVVAFAREMDAAKARWEIDMYGGTMHAFTNPQANDPGFGTVYSPRADARSWSAMGDFLARSLA